MQTKEETLKYIKTLTEQSNITEEELSRALNFKKEVKEEATPVKEVKLTNILYYIGGIIMFLGIAIFMAQTWLTTGFKAKVLMTFGAGILAYFIGLFFNLGGQNKTVSSIFFSIFAFTIPIGFMVILDRAMFNAFSPCAQSLVSGIMLGILLLLFIAFQRGIFASFSILFGTWLFFSSISWISEGLLPTNSWTFYMYRILGVGLIYILLGYILSKSKHTSLAKFLYQVGFLSVFGSAFVFFMFGKKFWIPIHLDLLAVSLLLGARFKNKAIFIWGVVFLTLSIIQVIFKYFPLGNIWPFTLVITGFTLLLIASQLFPAGRTDR